jgi:signal transduction histidine kinase
MLGLVLFAFLSIGFITIPFFKGRYEVFNSNRLQSLIHPIEHSIEQYIRTNEALTDTKSFDSISLTQEFKYYITGLSNSQRVDINIFNSNGELQSTSQENLYNKSLLARIINPNAYYSLHQLCNSILVQKETIGGLTYLSSYIPLRNEAGTTLGYVNIPFFSAQKEVDYQISNIMVTLVNLYAFIFLLSSLVAVVITNSITRTFNMIIKQFERVNLQKNELLEWPYTDEIGLLVQEYNKMVKKVEENAMLMAQTEREGAWREMARQVAHEIKNPLTPMKLNIQYLQQSLKNNHPNVKELADRVMAALIEQIDSLSFIASEFSNFAKMPDARPEDLDINELLQNAVEIYTNEPEALVLLMPSDHPIIVHTDRSQMLRVFTNILKNAVEAVPEERRAIIEVGIVVAGREVTVSFKDNGNGIPADVRERLFKPYFTTKSSGTGLGLAMTKKIVEFWQGTIWYETKESVGTTFYIQLPIQEMEA